MAEDVLAADPQPKERSSTFSTCIKLSGPAADEPTSAPAAEIEPGCAADESAPTPAAEIQPVPEPEPAPKRVSVRQIAINIAEAEAAAAAAAAAVIAEAEAVKAAAEAAAAAAEAEAEAAEAASASAADEPPPRSSRSRAAKRGNAMQYDADGDEDEVRPSRVPRLSSRGSARLRALDTTPPKYNVDSIDSDFDDLEGDTEEDDVEPAVAGPAATSTSSPASSTSKTNSKSGSGSGGHGHNVNPDEPPVAEFTNVQRPWLKKFTTKVPDKYMNHRFPPIGSANGRIEYDLDDEDLAWLDLYNAQRAGDSMKPISQVTLEHAINTLEKESFLSSQLHGDTEVPYDDEAVCCVCMSGECENVNAILFCDACNMAVHQECYGVPYIPEGQWLCRRCMHGSSQSEQCAMCPLKGGAMKQTDDGKHWVHILCALWIPELYFGSGSLREPVFGFDDVGRDRFRLNCYICGLKHKAADTACIQCYNSRCYAAFHVTCAQQSNLCMYLGEHHTGANCTVEAYCHLHTPKWSTTSPFISTTRSGALVKDFQLMGETKQKQAPGGAEAKKAMTIPSVLPDVLHALLEQNRVDPTIETATTIRQFWMLKRRSRRGVPLLRSMQDNLTKDSSSENSAELVKERKRFHYVRMHLEKTRMLVGQSLRRERIKRDQMFTDEQLFLMEVMPMRFVLEKTMEQFAKRDLDNVFERPVDLDVFPEYGRIVADPMDMAAMAKKIVRNDYTAFADFIADFQLMCENAIMFNGKETWWHHYAIDMLLQGNSILEVAGEFITTLPIEEDTGRLLEEGDRAPTPGAALSDVYAFSAEMVRDALATMPRPKKEDDRSIVIPMSPTSPMALTSAATSPHASPWSAFATPTDAAPVPTSANDSAAAEPNPIKAMGTALQFALGGNHAMEDADAGSPPTSPRKQRLFDSLGIIDGVSMQLAAEVHCALSDTISPAALTPNSVASLSDDAAERTPAPQAAAAAADVTAEASTLAAVDDDSPATVPATSAGDGEDASVVKAVLAEVPMPEVDVSMYDPVEFMLLKEMLHSRQLSRNGRSGRFRVLGSQLRIYRQNADPVICEKLRKKAGMKTSPVKVAAKKKKNDGPTLPPLVMTIRPGQVCWAKMAKFPWHPAEVFDPDPGAEVSSDPGSFYTPDAKVLSMCSPESRGAFGDCRGPDDKKKYLLLWFDKKRSWVWLTKSSLRAFNEDPAAAMVALNPKTQQRVRAALPSAEKQWKRFRAKERQSKAKKRAF